MWFLFFSLLFSISVYARPKMWTMAHTILIWKCGSWSWELLNTGCKNPASGKETIGSLLPSCGDLGFCSQGLTVLKKMRTWKAHLMMLTVSDNDAPVSNRISLNIPYRSQELNLLLPEWRAAALRERILFLSLYSSTVCSGKKKEWETICIVLPNWNFLVRF